MKRETETKFPVADFGDIREKLLGMDASLTVEGPERNWYLDTPDRQLKQRGGKLRIRLMGGFCTVTYKDNVTRGTVKAADEYQIELSEGADNALALFKKLGFTDIVFVYTKSRELWCTADPETTITFDDIPEIGKFVEIEAPEEEIPRYAASLDLDITTGITDSYPHLIKKARARAEQKQSS